MFIYSAFPSDRITLYWKRFFRFFFTVLALNLLHRTVTTRTYYNDIFWNVTFRTYNPEDYVQATKLLWEAYGSSILLGILSDIIFSFVVALIAALTLFKPWVRLTALVIFVVFLSANYEHIKYNHAHINPLTIVNALDWTFVAGQTTPGLLKVLFAFCILGSISLFVFGFELIRTTAGILMAPFFVVVTLGAGTYNYLQPDWMQRNPLLPSIVSNSLTTDTRSFADIARVTPSKIAAPSAKYNVLVIYMEGLSTKSLEIGRMENLSELATENITFSRYFGNQIVTANGLYAPLTGDHPYYLSTDYKWEYITNDNPIFREALPAYLNDLGYQTSFLQSAPLEYMNKGEILPQLGFSEVKGRASWTDGYSSNTWGIDDRALFKHVLDHIDTQDTNAPWFVSVLTTGTHSPYNIPDDFETDFTLERYKAISYLDFSIGELMQGLNDRELLENTVVIFTSDESRERSFESALLDEIVLHWLPMVIVHPSQKQQRFDFYMSSNMFPKLLPELLGSIDVKRLAALEQTDQPIIFGNPYSRKFFWFDARNGDFLMCGMPSFECAMFEDTKDIISLSTRTPDHFAYFPDLERMVRQLDNAQ